MRTHIFFLSPGQKGAVVTLECGLLMVGIKGLDKMIYKDTRLADYLRVDVVESLVMILKESDNVFIQGSKQQLVYSVRCSSLVYNITVFDHIKNYLALPLPFFNATAVVLVAVFLSYLQKSGLEAEMLYSILRAFLQLSVIGFVIEFIFTQDNSVWILAAYLFMVVVAGYTAGQRAKHVPRGKYVAGAYILVGTAVTMFLLVLLKVFPFTPRYIIPVAGMMVGNSMTVTGVTMKRLRDDIRTQMSLVSLNIEKIFLNKSQGNKPVLAVLFLYPLTLRFVV
ncbi:protein ALUMINUM SENSITIVE 3-like [Apium graveolens]|uniref:protein ALUMINUM SENSITIVE 3-like n=1 Tax=Apium graveolens TaxID=4045 RepID=UPI003D798E3E